MAVCDAVVEAAAHHFDARWAAMVFSGEDAGVGMARVFVHVSDGVIQRWEVPPRMLAALADQTLAAKGPVLADHGEGLEFGGEPCVIVAAPMPVHGKLAGILVVGLPDGVKVAPSDVSILVTLANHAGVALHNASLFQENERRAAELERRGSELEGTLRRLEQAGPAPAPQRGAQPDRARAPRQRLPAPADDRHEPRVVPAPRRRPPPPCSSGCWPPRRWRARRWTRSAR